MSFVFKMKTRLRKILSLIAKAAIQTCDRFYSIFFSILIKVLGFKIGNNYRPAWAPKDFYRLVEIRSPYLIYLHFPARQEGGHWTPSREERFSFMSDWIDFDYDGNYPVNKQDKEWAKIDI